MAADRLCQDTMSITDVEEFLRDPPPGFSVEARGTGCCVDVDAERCVVLIDHLESRRGKVVFKTSMGRKIKMHDLCEYTRVRRNLLSKRIYLLVSLCEDSSLVPGKKAPEQPQRLKRYVAAINGSNPFIKWQLERGLDRSIASVAGESYRVDIDFSEALETLAEGRWRDASFTLKYYSDAFFDFPHWFGFSKRKFQLTLT
ncbi:mesenteric estrogen-dependent adipogenesis protein-like isoform X2 [Lampris incognitus]|uniref:mesenteric estrogen-dependent adipogenesis protein-like isoform X2 n=1 Tax=Lampris incognitus TaxID=2546036 RepID=UPI0024B4E52F|nr:mesenteric estrogen-dependent adipogenesis protein-like isoform X2 [Lampris incognitus]